MGRKVNAFFWELECLIHPILMVVRNLFRQSFGLNRVRGFQSDRAFDGMFELADIARPGIGLGQRRGFIAKRQVAYCLNAKLLGTEGSEVRELLWADAQRGKHDE